MTEQETRDAAAEFIGTLMLVLVGAGAVVVSGGDVVAVALAHGLILAAIVATYGHISGAHVNPSVTLAQWISGDISSRKLVIYMVSQFVGGFVAVGILMVVLPTPGNLGQTAPANGVNGLDIVLVEGLLTFFLVSAIYQTAVYGKGGPAAPCILGFTLAGCIMMGFGLTGASLNPARTLAPALLASERQDFGEVLVYMMAIFGGGAMAAFLHMDTFRPDDVGESSSGLKKLRRSK